MVSGAIDLQSYGKINLGSNRQIGQRTSVVLRPQHLNANLRSKVPWPLSRPIQRVGFDLFHSARA
jgi:hypothetical protein